MSDRIVDKEIVKSPEAGFRPWSELRDAIELMNCNNPEEARLFGEWGLTKAEFRILQQGMRAIVVEEKDGESLTFQQILASRRGVEGVDPEKTQRFVLGKALVRTVLLELPAEVKKEGLGVSCTQAILGVVDKFLKRYDEVGLEVWGKKEIADVVAEVRETMLKDEIERRSLLAIKDLKTLVLKRRGSERLKEVVNVFRALRDGKGKIDPGRMDRVKQTLTLWFRREAKPEVMIDVFIRQFESGVFDQYIYKSIEKIKNKIANLWDDKLWKEWFKKHNLPEESNVRNLVEANLVMCEDDDYTANSERIYTGVAALARQLFRTQVDKRIEASLLTVRPNIESLDRAAGEISKVEAEWQRLTGKVLLSRVQRMGKGELGNLQKWMTDKYKSVNNIKVFYDELKVDRPQLASRLEQLRKMARVVGLDQPDYNMLLYLLIQATRRVGNRSDSLAGFI